MMPEPMAYMGMKIIVSPLCETQKIKISDSFEHCTPAFRQEMNNWLADRFGIDSDMIRMGDKILVGPHAYEKLKHEIKKHQY